MEFVKSGAAAIQYLIDESCREGKRAITITGCWEIEKTIRIPSDFSLTLQDCHLRMADNTFCNMFVNEHCGTELGRTREGCDRNITITGLGHVILDGGEYNGLGERNAGRDGRPPIWVNNLLLFTNVEGFAISNLQVRNQRWWALNFIGCSHGRILNIDVLADCSWVDDSGGLRRGYFAHDPATGEETGFNYEKIRIKNADGIDLRSGCHDIFIENITGFSEDDTVALTGLKGVLEENFCVPGENQDIYNVIIRNVMAAAYCANVRLLNQSGICLYNILVDGVFDASKGCAFMDRGGSGVRLGDNHMYGTRHATADETYNITIRNVHSRAGAALRLAGAMSSCCFENICTFDERTERIENHASVDISSFLR